MSIGERAFDATDRSTSLNIECAHVEDIGVNVAGAEEGERLVRMD